MNGSLEDRDDTPGNVYGDYEPAGGNGHDRSPDARPIHRRSVRRAARGLGWFSLGLGLAEVLMPGAVARATGMHGRETLVRACGLREIATGLGLLLARDPTPWLWARVAGDAVDLATLGAHVGRGNPRSTTASRSPTTTATAAACRYRRTRCAARP